MVANRVVGIVAVILLAASGYGVVWSAMRMVQLVALMERGVDDSLLSVDVDGGEKGAGFSRATIGLAGAMTAMGAAVLVCLLAWARAAAFRDAGGQWNGYVYVFLVSIACTPVLQWSALLYVQRIAVEMNCKVYM